MNTKAVGLIGVGLLGSALAKRFIEAGIEVHGFDNNEGQLLALSQCGGIAGKSTAALVAHCDVLFLSLPSSDVVLDLVREHAENFRSDQVVVDTTTGDPAQMIAIGEALESYGVQYLEATVAGSSRQVEAGEVALFLGGESEVVRAAGPLLAAITSRQFHLGSVGTASRFKLVHNLVLGLHRAVLAEALTFSESLGFETGETLRILQQTPASSGVMETKGQRMVEHNYELQARLSQHLKDVRLILAEAERVGASTPLSQMHEMLLEKAECLGFGDADNSAVIESFRSANRKGGS